MEETRKADTKVHVYRDNTDSDKEELAEFDMTRVMASITQTNGIDGDEREIRSDADSMRSNDATKGSSKINPSAGKGNNQQPESTPVARSAAQFLILQSESETSLQKNIAVHKRQVEQFNRRRRKQNTPEDVVAEVVST
jgi:hypothetical protein